jgi:hypothetical protein
MDAHKIAAATWLTIGVAYTAAQLWLGEPWMPANGTDMSWLMALHEIVPHPLAMGDGFVCTFGPLGFLYGRLYHPATYTWWFVFRGAFVALLLVSCLLAARRARLRPEVTMLWLLVSASCLALTEDGMFACYLVMVGAIGLLGIGGPLLLALHAVLCGAVALSKFSLLPHTAVVIAALLAHEVWVRRDRRMAAAALLIVPAFMVFWYASGQSVSILDDFFVHSLDVAAGYSEAMALDSKRPPMEMNGYLAAATLATAAIISAKPLGATRPFAGAIFVWSAFALFKHGFVRHDGHALHATATIFCLALGGWLFARVRARGVAATLLLLATLSAAASLSTSLTKSTQLGGHLIAAPSQVFHHLSPERIKARWTTLPTVWQATLRRMAAEEPLVVEDGTYDIYSFDQFVLFAHQLRWRPRPVFQSYVAYTEALARLNEHAIEAAGADHILFTLQPIDRRLPMLEDGPSHRALLAGYEPVARTGKRWHLRRRPQARACERLPLADIEGRFGERLDVGTPPDALIWATLDIRPTLLGRLQTFLYKPPFLDLNVRLSDGSEQTHRVIVGMARAGFFLSPMAATTDAFITFFPARAEARAALPRVEGIVLNCRSPGACDGVYDARYRLTLERFQCSL